MSDINESSATVDSIDRIDSTIYNMGDNSNSSDNRSSSDWMNCSDSTNDFFKN